MNKNTGIIVGIIAVIVIFGGVFASMNIESEVMVAENSMEQKSMEDKGGSDENMSGEENMADKENMQDKGDGMMKAGSYEEYSADKLARAETGDVVLFFHASWCPSCRALNANIESNLTSIPEGLTILKTNYDTETSLKQKYGVTYQHTLVQVDKDGNMITKWSGGSTLDSVVSQVQ